MVVAEKAAEAESDTYRQILGSAALIGGSSVLNVAIGIIRAKAMALFLGPAGFGLAGMYGSIASLTQTVAGLGINTSGVRQIAEAAGSHDIERLARTAAVLRSSSLVLGGLGAALSIVFSKQISSITFGSDQHAAAICLLSIAVFFNLVSAGQNALIQGLRRISDLAKMGVLGTFLGTLIAIPIVYFFRQNGVVPSLVALAAMTIVTSWWFSNQVRIETRGLTASIALKEVAALLKLGFAFMSSGLMTMGVAYIVRVTVLRKVGLEGAGLYQAAWTVGGLYVGFILQAMGADFYPRLTASADNNTACNRMVNEQTHIGLLLAGPGVLATLTFAPLVLAIFYSSTFGAASAVLRWICLGVTLQVITWPIGFIMVAKGKQTLFFFSDLAWTIVALGLAWTCVRFFGLTGAGIAFFGSYLFHGLLVFPIAHRLSGFCWSGENIRTGLLFLASIGVVFSGFYVLPPVLATGFGALVAALSGAYSMRVLLTLVSHDQIPSPLRRIIVGLRLFSSRFSRS